MSAGLEVAAAPAAVLRLGAGFFEPIAALLGRHGLELRRVEPGTDIPGSYWGAPEAGLEGSVVWVRDDTPVHSALHEGCHALCMDEARLSALERDAGGDFEEENAVCCLQILLAAELNGVGSERLMQDMDAWGYTFRLGSARAWYTSEAEDARAWLVRRGLLDAFGRIAPPRAA